MKTKIFRPLIFGLIIILTGCEQKFDNVIDNSFSEYQVVNVLPSDSIFYNSTDSLVTVNVQFNTSATIQFVFCYVYFENGEEIYSLSLFDNGLKTNGDVQKGDKIFSNKFPLSKNDPNGKYDIKYFVTDQANSTKFVALSSFEYNNGQYNSAPIISNLVLVDSTQRNVPITFSVDVLDSNGLVDIKEVYYELYKPDGYKIYNSDGISMFPLFDDGNTSYNGDVTAKDGQFTTQLTFPTDISTGLWRFEFRAKDRNGELSNKIIKSVKVL